MSTIEKLSIRGIRSFGHEDHDRQIVEFFHPLTLITGHNGAGKTSVIECLRYITTGDAPPLAKTAGFVHDPKAAHETEVKAQVKLVFKDVTGKQAVVTRNLTATQKLKSITTKTLEGVISRYNDYGEKTSLSSKCAEIDREMVASLGVSKAVLINVIFCHQEDSNWPLGEGRALKIKFDEIFAATRYIKALDTMGKTRKELASNIKEYQVEVKYLKQNKDKAKQLQDDCTDKKAQLSAAKDSVNKIKQLLIPINERLKNIDAQDDEVSTHCTELEKLKAGKTQMSRNIQDLEDGLEQIFQGPLDELRRIYREHQDTLKEKQISLKQYEKQIGKSRKDVDRIRTEKSGHLVQQGKLEQEEKQHRDTVAKRNKKISKAAQEFNIPGYDDMGDNSQIQDFVKSLDDNAKTQEREITECKQKYEEQLSVLEKQIQELRDTNTKLQHTMKMKTDSMKQNKFDLKRITDDLSKMDATAARLPELDEDLKRTERNLEETQASMNIDEMKEEIQQLQAEKKEKETAMSKLSKEMSALSMQSKARAQMEMLQKEKNSKEDQIRKIRGRHEDEVTRLMGHFPTEKMRGKLSDFLVQKQSEVKDVRRKLEKAKGDLSSLKANRKMLMEENKKLQDRLNTSKETLLDVCDEGEDLDQSVQDLQQSINNLQSEKGALTGSTHLFERYIRNLERQDAMCPLCHRGFDAQPEVDELVQELRDKLRLAPTKLQEKERSVMQQRDKLNKLMELKPVKDNMTKLSTTEIPEVKSKLTTVNSSIEKLQRTISEQESSLSFLQEEERSANDMKPDIWQMDRCQGELKELERKIATQSVQLSGTDANRTIQQVNSERQSLELNLGLVSRKLEQKQQQVEEQTERIQMLQVSINSITSEKLRLTMLVQQEEKLQEQQVELKSAIQTFQREIKEAKDQLQPVQNRLSELTEEKSDVIMQKEADTTELKMQVDTLRQKKNEITNLTSDINRYLNGSNRDKLESCQQTIQDVQKRLDSTEQQLNKLTDNISQLQEDLAKQQVHERELADNLQLRKKQKEVDDVERAIAAVEEKLEGFDTKSLKIERRRLNDEYSKKFKEKNHAEGRQDILAEDVRKIDKELNDDMFKDAELKYHNKMIELRTTEIANTDLEKYCRALDKAIMSYHGLKMSEINKIIRDLWRTTYRGNDIDYVEIRSEDETGVNKVKKTYNYRVVMVKGDIALDMRGRCSAGQKVLASLIIRLALAETFCLNCGILALDEPTTNLDKDNIESLAHALVDIIKSREGQRNFQLIVITHDEDFVELLGRSDYCDYFYRIAKNDEYKSVVRRLDISTLHAVVTQQ